MTDQPYGDYEFEICFDGVEGRTPGCGTALRCQDLTWPRCLTTLPIQLEGIRHCDEVGSAKDEVGSAKDYGVEGTYCPNHGGRRANGGLPAPRLRSLEPT